MRPAPTAVTTAAGTAEFDLPEELSAIAARLERSRALLTLGDDWDGEGSPGYAEATWQRAAEIVLDAATARHRHQGSSPPPPIISPSDDGSIDIQWRTSHRNVLINIPARSDEPVTFYAHDAQNPRRDHGGELEAGPMNERLLAWLME